MNERARGGGGAGEELNGSRRRVAPSQLTAGRGAPSSAAAYISLPDREPPPTSRLAEKESAFVSRPLPKLADEKLRLRRSPPKLLFVRDSGSAADDGGSTDSLAAAPPNVARRGGSGVSVDACLLYTSPSPRDS